MVTPEPNRLIEDQPEPWVLRACLWGEARGESRRGQLAVLHVIRNRALRSDTTLKAQVLKPLQFSSFNKSDPNRDKMLMAHLSPEWRGIDAVCELFEQGCTDDPTDGARNYFVADMPNPPAWGPPNPKWEDHVMIGRHRFGTAHE